MNTFAIGSLPVHFSVAKLFNFRWQYTFEHIEADIYTGNGVFDGKKNIYCYDKLVGNIVKWITTFKDESNFHIGFMNNPKNDFQHQSQVYIINEKNQLPTPRGWWITVMNLIPMCIFLAVRKCIPATWLNDRDQFLYPNDGWQTDEEFQADCLAYTLFNNNIQSRYGTNHWIPFTEEEVDAKEKFESHFMSDYIRGKLRAKSQPDTDLFSTSESDDVDMPAQPLCFSPEAQAVMDAGRGLWRYYHAQPGANPNAALYDIRLHFQGINEKGKMNPDSNDLHYMELITALRQNLKLLARKIEPKVYEYGFLLK